METNNIKYDLTVIAPCFNESQNVIELTERLQKTFGKKSIHGEIVLVNDASADNTGELIDELAKRYSNVRAVHHAQNLGIARAWQSGLSVSNGIFVCLIDADLQNLPEDVGRLYQEIMFSRSDMVQGWRNHVGKLNHGRYFLSRGLNFLLNVLFGMRSKDNKSGFVICRKEVLEDILTHAHSYYHPQTLITAAAKYKGYSIREVETLFQDRIVGASYIGVFPLKTIVFTFIDALKGFFEFRLSDQFDGSLRNFLTHNPPKKSDPSLPFWRSLYFKFYILLFPLHHWTISYNAARHYRDFKKSQWLSREQLRAYQNLRLRQLMIHAYHHVPFYREFFEREGLKPEDIKTLEDLQRFPCIDKKSVRENLFLGIMSDNHDKKNIQKVQTSGSTGEPFVVFAEKKQLEMRWAATQRSLEWTGYQFGDRQVRLWHKYLGMKKNEIVKEILDAKLTRRKFIPAYEISDDNLEKYVSDMMRYRPVLLDGYAESYHLLARFLKYNKYKGHKPKGIMSSGQTLPNESRKIIEETFGCGVFDKYGGREFVGGVAYQCEVRNGYHVVDECNIVEILKDGRPAVPGEVGEVVITELNNYAMPLIRYKIGDLAVQRDPQEVCPCGRGLSLIGEIQGRIQAIVIGTDNQFIPGTFFNRVFFKHDAAIRQYQVIQEKQGELRLKIIKANLFTDKVLAEIFSDIRMHMGHDLRIHVEFVEEIPLGRTGKRQYCISLLDPLHVSKNLDHIKQ